METVTINLYRFEELSAAAQQIVIDNYNLLFSKEHKESGDRIREILSKGGIMENSRYYRNGVRVNAYVETDDYNKTVVRSYIIQGDSCEADVY